LTITSASGSDLVVTGVAAHIAGERPGSARHDQSMTEEQRNHYNNLIYLCGDHHTQIDQQEIDFPVKRLLEIKANHENKVREAVNAAFAEVGFPELAQATAWISRLEAGQASYDFSVVPLADKIRKNELSSSSIVTITMGLTVVREVKEFIEQEAKLDADFPEKLKAGFLEEYYRLRKEGQRGDILFELMCQFSQHGMTEQAGRSAALAVLIYLFECCEVFEK